MSMQKLRGIRRGGEYTAQRSTLEHLLHLEEIILEKAPRVISFQEERERLAQQFQQYKALHRLNNPFGIEDIQHYLLITTEKELEWHKSAIRGIYTSTLIEQTEGNQPITINMLGQRIDHLLYTINTPRHITIKNTKGDYTGALAGSDHGTAHLTINNTKGNCTGLGAGCKNGTAHLTINNTEGEQTGAWAGNNHGQAHLTIDHTNGNWTGESAGSHYGKAHLTITKTKGDCTGVDAGNDHGTAQLIITHTQGNYTGLNAGTNNGKAIIVAYNTKGACQFQNRKGGIFVSHNRGEAPRIGGLDNLQTITHIQKLIEKNAPAETIMEYLTAIQAEAKPF